MVKLVYKGKINGMDVVYKDACFICGVEEFYRENKMIVVTIDGDKTFHFNTLRHGSYSIVDKLKKQEDEMLDDNLKKVIIKEKGKKKKVYKYKNIDDETTQGLETKLVFKKAINLYNGIKQEIFEELKEKEEYQPNLTVDNISTKVDGLFEDKGAREDYPLILYKEDSEKFIEFFDKEEIDNQKEILELILNCDYENKEVIDWLDENKKEMVREIGLES